MKKCLRHLLLVDADQARDVEVGSPPMEQCSIVRIFLVKKYVVVYIVSIHILAYDMVYTGSRPQGDGCWPREISQWLICTDDN